MPDLPASSAPSPEELSSPHRPWYSEMNRYHWFVFVVAALGWLFDCLDQQLFILARQPAMTELLSRRELITNEVTGETSTIVVTPEKTAVDAGAAYATSIFLMGWACGGLVFGIMGDRVGRAKTMILTILIYSIFTGLSALSLNFWDFCLYRFLTGLGVGGEFAVGVSLVAEVMPHRARPYALSLLQALSAVGNVTAALVAIFFGHLQTRGLESPWRYMFLVGAIPALLALFIRRRLKEPERWQQVAHEGTVARQLGSYRELFGHPLWRKHALLGMVLAFAGVVGLWGVGFFTMDLVGNVLTPYFEQSLAEQHGIDANLWAERKVAIQRGASATPVEEEFQKAVNGSVGSWKGYTSIMINFGAFLGMYGFGLITARVGRKPAFVAAFLAASVSTAAVFYFLDSFAQIFFLAPVMGFCQLSLFAGYAIYFPELFPTHLRSTGTSFCYNVGRFVAALGPAALGLMTTQVYAHTEEPLRWAGLTMCSVFLLGLFALPFLPETKGRPLPE